MIVAVLAPHVRGQYFAHCIQLVQLPCASEAQYVLAPAWRLHQTLGATAGADVGVGGEHTFQARFKAGLGHIVQQVPGGPDVDALAAQLL
ncbi:hypothetical protein D3C76_1360820 [compost metagenome]